MRDRVVEKYNKLLAEYNELGEYIQYLEREYNVITDQYMEGIILGPIGKEQNRLMKLRDKAIKRRDKIEKEAVKIKQKYSIQV